MHTILTCPECRAQYEIDPAMIDEAGREVRCSSCGHEWVQKPEDLPPATEAGQQVEDQPSEPGQDPAEEQVPEEQVPEEQVTEEQVTEIPVAEDAADIEIPTAGDQQTQQSPSMDIREDATIPAQAAADDEHLGVTDFEHARQAPQMDHDETMGLRDEEHGGFFQSNMFHWGAFAGLVAILGFVVVIGSGYIRDRFAPQKPPGQMVETAQGVPEIDFLGQPEYKWQPKEDRMVLVVSGRIVNQSDEKKSAPKIIVHAIGANEEILATWDVASEPAEIGPGEIANFNKELEEVDSSVTTDLSFSIE